MTENKINIQKIDEIIKHLEEIKQEIEKLQNEILQINYEAKLEYVFNNLRKITNDHPVESIIFIDNNNVKYIAKYPESSGALDLIIYNNKAYYWYIFNIQNNELVIKYFEEYNIPNEIIEILKILQESNINYAEPIFFKLYYLLKQNYPINLIKIK